MEWLKPLITPMVAALVSAFASWWTVSFEMSKQIALIDQRVGYIHERVAKIEREMNGPTFEWRVSQLERRIDRIEGGYKR